MDVFFHPTRGKPFCLEIGYFDTVLEIKEKIQKKQNIPISKQTLIFDDSILHDDLNVHNSNILDRSRIQLVLVAEPPENLIIKKEPSSPPCKIKKIQLLVKTHTLKSGIAVEMDPDDTIQMLKEKIRGVERVPSNLLSVHANGIELHNHRTIRDCELSDGSEIDVSIKTASTISTSDGTAKNLKIQVLTSGGARKIPIEVNFSDNVGELKKELFRLNQTFHLNLPQEGYFFIYKQNVMDDDRSFRWHHVGQGDTIEIFSGSISGGL